MEKLQIVPVEQIPIAADVALDNLAETYNLCQQLQELCEAESGIGISAVQAGVAQKLFLIKLRNEYHYFLNCSYQPFRSVKKSHREACLSLKSDDGKLRWFEV